MFGHTCQNQPPVTGNPTALQFDIKFNFQASFPFQDNVHTKKWYWDHIKDFSNNGNDNVFVLRICDVADTTQSNCLFANVPHLSKIADDYSKFCTSNTSCSLPEETNTSSPKIYHYTADKAPLSGTGLVSSDIQYDKFNVLFDVTELAPLKSGGGLDTPVSLSEKFKIGNSTEYRADIWYCAEPYNSEVLPTNQPSAGIRQFNNLCGGNQPYFKIAQSETFKMPTTKEEALGSVPGTVDPVNTTPSDSDSNSTLPVCHILNGAGPGEGTFMGCIAQVGYYLLYQPSAWIAGILGRVMDFFLGYSIDDASYRASVVVTGWKLVRDISNIFFIIILIWTGFATVFDLGGISMKKVVPALIINALIINFSLFGTQVIIDISNITARLFYNTMSVCDGPCKYKDPPHEKEISNPNTETTGGYKPLSTKIVDSFDPQKIFKPGNLSNTPVPANKDNTTVNSASGGFNSSGISSNVEGGATLGIYDSDYAGYFLIVSIIACIIMLAMAKMFFGVMFMFVGRVVGLYMSMIFSPFAVLTRGNMPLVGSIKELSWSKWISDLTSYALLAPIFVFFLYIIYAFINSDMMTIFKLDSEAGFMNTVIAVAIPMIIVYMLISYGVEIAKKYAGTAGNMLQKYATQATGIVGGAALGIATGGAAFLGTRSAGLMKLSEDKRAELSAKKAEGGLAGRLASMRLGLNDKAQTGTFDMRKTKAFGGLTSLAGKAGISLNDKVSGAIGLGSDATKGGMKAIEKKEKEDLKKKIESIKTDVTDSEAVKRWEAKAKKLADKQKEGFLADEESHTSALVASLMKENKDLSKEDAEKQVKDMKTNNTFKDTAADLAKKKIAEDYGTVETNKQLTQALRQEFAQTIAEGRTFGQQVSTPLTVAKGAVAGAVAPGALGALASAGGAVPLMAVAYDQNRKKRNEKDQAKKYFEDSKKDRKKHKLPKEDRLENEKKKLEEELGEMDEYVESISGTLSNHFDKIIEQAKAGNVKYAKYKDRELGSFGKDPEDTNAAKESQKASIKVHEQNLKNEIESHDYDIKSKHDQIGIAKRAGNKDLADTLEAERNELIAKKNEVKENLEKMNEQRRSRVESELNKKEDALDKIKEKKEKKDEA